MKFPSPFEFFLFGFIAANTNHVLGSCNSAAGRIADVNIDIDVNVVVGRPGGSALKIRDFVSNAAWKAQDDRILGFQWPERLPAVPAPGWLVQPVLTKEKAQVRKTAEESFVGLSPTATWSLSCCI
jgi:hypothetical protein